jgi:serine/threonine protein kinase
MPHYFVKPTAYPIDLKTSFESIKIVDFGQSFLSHDSPSEFNTPPPVHAPEIIFKDKVDYCMDLWSMGCMVSLPLRPSAMTSNDGKLMVLTSSLNSLLGNRCSIAS